MEILDMNDKVVDTNKLEKKEQDLANYYITRRTFKMSY